MQNTVSLEEELRKANAARGQLETYKRQVREHKQNSSGRLHNTQLLKIKWKPSFIFVICLSHCEETLLPGNSYKKKKKSI